MSDKVNEAILPGQVELDALLRQAFQAARDALGEDKFEMMTRHMCDIIGIESFVKLTTHLDGPEART
jgi:hypothetical protein